MNHIEVRELPGKYIAEHPAIIVDGLTLDLVLHAASATRTDTAAPGYEGLVPAMFALIDSKEHLWATSVSLNFSLGRRLVPLLVCPDCCDTSCSVVLADTVFNEAETEWQRIGTLRAVTGLSASYDDVAWLENLAPFRFDRASYVRAFQSLAGSPRLWRATAL